MNKEKYEVYTNNRDTVVVIVRGKLEKFYRGVAKCNSQDTFDYNRGVDIALNKALILLNKDKIQDSRHIISSCRRSIGEASRQIEKHTNRINKWQEEINTMKNFNKSC